MAVELKSSLVGAPNDGAPIDQDAIAEIFAEIALEAAVAVMAVYASDAMRGASPTKAPSATPTKRPRRSSGAPRRAAAEFPVLAEEAAAHGKKTVAGATFILVDPVDGTREFLAHNGEFTDQYRADRRWRAACRRRLRAGARAALDRRRERPTSASVAPGAALPPRTQRREDPCRGPRRSEGLTALASRSHSDPETEAFLATTADQGAPHRRARR